MDGLPALELLERDEGDSVECFVLDSRHGLVFVLSASGLDIDQNMSFDESLPEIRQVFSTFQIQP